MLLVLLTEPVFPGWLAGAPIAKCKERLVLEWKGIKVGIMGLVEKNWYSKLTTVDTDYWEFTDPIDEAPNQARRLRVRACCSLSLPRDGSLPV
jgi:hypothetical protein